jgi:hypothetical protein
MYPEAESTALAPQVFSRLSAIQRVNHIKNSSYDFYFRRNKTNPDAVNRRATQVVFRHKTLQFVFSRIARN